MHPVLGASEAENRFSALLCCLTTDRLPLKVKDENVVQRDWKLLTLIFYSLFFGFSREEGAHSRGMGTGWEGGGQD